MKRIFVIFTTISLVFTACEKEEEIIEGCTDTGSVNYNSNATNDNGSCKYNLSINELNSSSFEITHLCMQRRPMYLLRFNPS